MSVIPHPEGPTIAIGGTVVDGESVEIKPAPPRETIPIRPGPTTTRAHPGDTGPFAETLDPRGGRVMATRCECRVCVRGRAIRAAIESRDVDRLIEIVGDLAEELAETEDELEMATTGDGDD